jgi:hypothetical protein
MVPESSEDDMLRSSACHLHCQKRRCLLIGNLVGGMEHFLFFHILGIINPTDFHIFQRGTSTTNQTRIE